MRWTRFVPVLISILAVGCEGGTPGSPTDLELASIRVTAYTAGTPIASLSVTVTAADIPNPLVFNLTVDGVTQTAGGTVKVSPGLDRTFTVEAFDVDGEATHDGTAVLNVKPGNNPPIQITLSPRSGHVPITVSFGSFTVLVTPASSSMAINTSTLFSAEIQDQNGAVLLVPSGELTWASTNPAYATVDALGSVTATAQPGTTSIVVTYNGVAGIAQLTVILGDPAADADGDGWTVGAGDCDDANAAIYPGAPEVLNGIDDDCDGEADEGVTAEDQDGDGWTAAPLDDGDPNTIDMGDCNDFDASIYPGATETAGDGIDSNCDGGDDT